VYVDRPAEKTAEKPAPKPEGPKDDPKQAQAARVLYTSAQDLFKQGKHREALVDLDTLTKEYVSLHYTQGLSDEIAKMSSACHTALRNVESARAKPIDEARQIRRDGRWPEAAVAFQALVKSGLSEYQAEVDACRREIDAGNAIKDIEAARDAGKWIEVFTKVHALEQQHAQHRIETVEKSQGDLTALKVRAFYEGETAKILGEAHAAAQAGNWKQLQRLLVDVEKHRESDTYKAKEQDIKDLRTQYAKANEAAADDDATRAWALSLKSYSDLLQEKKYDDAADLMEDYRVKHGASRVGKGKEPEISVKIADAYKKRQVDKNDEAKKLLPLAKKEITAGNFEVAQEIVTRLAGDLADTDFAKSNAATIKNYKKICDERARQPAHILVEMDFEDFPGSWTLNGQATGSNAFEEPQQGRRSARLTIPSSGRASHPLIGMTSRAESISFWARSRGRNSTSQLIVFLHDDSGASSLSYSYELTITTDWKQYPIRLAEFKPFNKPAMGTTFSPGRVRSFSLESGGGAGQILELQIDTLRVEAQRVGK
jgi:hypothetical protein